MLLAFDDGKTCFGQMFCLLSHQTYYCSVQISEILKAVAYRPDLISDHDSDIRDVLLPFCIKMHFLVIASILQHIVRHVLVPIDKAWHTQQAHLHMHGQNTRYQRQFSHQQRQPQNGLN